ncbi:hypothetical protein TSUD_214060 [Trifolium subterraneum]|uniref:Uncharacterized protein n=1 Tax=Trifolium subterraneum TaxID=3900 RepID=A0A2Z6MKC9_TRISU|nr:hypothetical protein TSUD_214060 [Trifolium subterraneum]
MSVIPTPTGLGKWVWKVRVVRSGLWYRIMVNKYGVNVEVVRTRGLIGSGRAFSKRVSVDMVCMYFEYMENKRNSILVSVSWCGAVVEGAVGVLYLNILCYGSVRLELSWDSSCLVVLVGPMDFLSFEVSFLCNCGALVVSNFPCPFGSGAEESVSFIFFEIRVCLWLVRDPKSPD